MNSNLCKVQVENMNDRDRFIADRTKCLEARQEELLAQGLSDEAIPVQIAQLGSIWDVHRQGRKWNPHLTL